MCDKCAEHHPSNATAPDPKQEWVAVVCISEGDEWENQISYPASDTDSESTERDPDVANEQSNCAGIEQNKTDDV